MNKTWILVLWVMCSLLIGCKSEYEQLVKSELASGILHEDLFFGLKMGQEQKEFFQICWDLNKQKIISQGPKNEYVRYEMKPNEIPNEPEKVEMLFYGIFDEEKVMRGVRKRFSYLGWSLWNKEFHSNKLAEKLKDYYLQTYGGNDFIEIDEGIKEISTYVKVDGNRQILIYPADTKDVVVKIEDTRYKLSKQ
jgi:hypothetical protein